MSIINLKCVFWGRSSLKKIIESTVKTLKTFVNILEYRRNNSVIQKSRGAYENLELSMEWSFKWFKSRTPHISQSDAFEYFKMANLLHIMKMAASLGLIEIVRWMRSFF